MHTPAVSAGARYSGYFYISAWGKQTFRTEWIEKAMHSTSESSHPSKANQEGLLIINGVEYYST